MWLRQHRVRQNKDTTRPHLNATPDLSVKGVCVTQNPLRNCLLELKHLTLTPRRSSNHLLRMFVSDLLDMKAKGALWEFSLGATSHTLSEVHISIKAQLPHGAFWCPVPSAEPQLWCLFVPLRLLVEQVS